MRKVCLRMNEEYKYNIIKKLVETNGNKKSASVKLKCTTRTINRLINLYVNQGKEGFVHKNRSGKPSTTFSKEIKNKIVSLYINEYFNANLTHFTEIVKEELNIKVSDVTINKWLREKFILSPKARRKTKKDLNKQLKIMLSDSKSIKQSNNIITAIETIESVNAHPRRPRSKYAGEMIQMDASSFEWIMNETWHLHVAIDDASGAVVGAYFDVQETLNGYYNVFYQILTNYGIPDMFYTDRRTIFDYKRKETAFDNEDTFTQFSYACRQLGVSIQTSSIAQAKGRVERLNQTLQSRLPIELKRANITSIEKANEFLKSYLEKFNKQFALYINDTNSVYVNQPSVQEIKNILAVLSNRTIDAGHSIKFKNNFYIPVNSKNEFQYFPNKTKCIVIQSFVGELYTTVGDKVYGLQMIKKHEAISKEFDIEIPEKKKPKRYIPPMSHPWKSRSFNNHINKQKHRDKSGAYV